MGGIPETKSVSFEELEDAPVATSETIEEVVTEEVNEE